MKHTLLTFTPLQDAREDTGFKAVIPCIPLTQPLGPMPLAQLDANGWAVWQRKIALVDGQYLQIAPVINEQVMPAEFCFDVLNRQNAIKLTISPVPAMAGYYQVLLEPAGSNPVSPNNNTTRLSAMTNQPQPSMEIATLRDRYMTAAQTVDFIIIGTIDTRPGKSAKLVFGASLIVWAEANALLFEWSAV